LSIRVQIVRAPNIASIDGVQLDGFETGVVYDVGTSIAAVLLAEGWAVPVPIDAPVPPTPFSEADPCSTQPYRDPDAPPNLTREHYPPYLDRARAAELPPRMRTRKR
jgi:hypothetical protein